MYLVTENYQFIEFPKNKPKCRKNFNLFKLLISTEVGYRIVDGEWFDKVDRFHNIPEQFYTLDCGICVIENVVGFCQHSSLNVVVEENI